jgi:hypothetical protein
VDREKVTREAIERTENTGIVFIDEIDKIVATAVKGAGPDISAQLAAICKSEKVKAAPDVLLLIARKARGSMRDALSLMDQAFSFFYESECIGTVYPEQAFLSKLFLKMRDIFATFIRSH